MTAHFSDATFDYLADLDQNNSKDWFEANRDRYETCWKAPGLAFIDALADEMAALDPSLTAVAKINGSLRRINRDVRFSKDKSPYSASMHLVFWAKDHPSAHPNRSPGMHFVLYGGGIGFGAGQWGLGPAQLQTWRDLVVDKVEGPRVIEALEKAAATGTRLGEPDLARLPKGFTAEGRAADLLRHKSVVSRTYDGLHDKDHLTGAGAMDWALEMTRAHLPLLRLLMLL